MGLAMPNEIHHAGKLVLDRPHAGAKYNHCISFINEHVLPFCQYFSIASHYYTMLYFKSTARACTNYRVAYQLIYDTLERHVGGYLFF